MEGQLRGPYVGENFSMQCGEAMFSDRMSYMSNTPKPLRFDTSEFESCVNIPEVESGKQCVKMSSMVYRKSNRVLKYRKSRGVSNV